MKNKKQLSKIGLLMLAGLTTAHALDFEQQLLIENEGLHIVLAQDALPKSVNLASDTQQAPQESSSNFSSSAEAGLDNLLGTASADSIDSGLDSLLGNDPLPTDDGLGDLLGGLDSGNEAEGLGGLDALLDDTPSEKPMTDDGLGGLDALLGDTDTVEVPATNDPLSGLDSILGEAEISEEAAAPSGFDGLLADIGSPAEPETVDPLSGLDGLLGGSVEVEEAKIEGIGKQDEPKMKKEKPKKVSKEQVTKPSKETSKTKKNTSKKLKQNKKMSEPLIEEVISPLDRKLKTDADINFNELIQQIATIGGWQLNLSEEFKSLSTKKIGLRFNNVPLSFLLKWVSSQTSLPYKLKKEKLSI